MPDRPVNWKAVVARLERNRRTLRVTVSGEVLDWLVDCAAELDDGSTPATIAAEILADIVHDYDASHAASHGAEQGADPADGGQIVPFLRQH